MKNRGTTALIVLFFAGLIGLWVGETWCRSPPPPSVDRNKGVHPDVDLINVKSDDLRKIEIQGPSESLVFERREGNRWQMTTPLNVAANPSMVEGLAFKLKELTRKPQAGTLDGDPAGFGLAPANRRVMLWGQATAAPIAAIDLGTVSLDRRYVRASTPGAGVEVVPAQGLEVVDLPPVRWRDREVFRVPTFEVDALQIQAPAGNDRPAQNLQFARSLDAWRIVAPIRVLAVEGKVEGLIASFGSLRITNEAQYVANDVPEAELDRYGLKNPSLTVSISAGRGSSRRPVQMLQVGKPVEGNPERLYALVGDQDDVISVDTGVLNGLARARPSDFRSERVADFAPNRVTHFEVESRGKAYKVWRSGRDWRLDDPGGRADPKAVAEFFQALEGLRTGNYLPPNSEATRESGLDRPAEIIRVWQTPAAPAASTDLDRTVARNPEDPWLTLKLGKRDAGKKVLYAQTGEDETVLALPDTVASALFKQSWAFRDRLILTAATEQIERIRFDGLGKQVTLQAPPIKLNLTQNAPTGWWLSEPVLALADDPAVAKLLKLLAAFRVDGFAADGPVPLASYGLDHPALKVTWSVPATAAVPSPVPLPPPSDPATGVIRFDDQTLLIGAPVPDRKSMRYAMLQGLPVVFMVGGENLATLDAEWHDHRIAKFDPDQVETVHLTWPGTDWSFNLARTAAGWSIVGPMDVPGFAPEPTPAALQAAAILTTTRFLQYAGETPSTVGLTPPRLTLRFVGPKLTQPVELALSGVLDNGQCYAQVSAVQPGAVFLVDAAPFAPWLKLRPPVKLAFPDDVFLREPAAATNLAPAPGPADRPGQTGGEPR